MIIVRCGEHHGSRIHFASLDTIVSEVYIFVLSGCPSVCLHVMRTAYTQGRS